MCFLKANTNEKQRISTENNNFSGLTKGFWWNLDYFLVFLLLLDITWATAAACQCFLIIHRILRWLSVDLKCVYFHCEITRLSH